MENPTSQIEAIYNIKRVREVFFSINETLHVPDPAKIIQLELGHLIGFNTDQNMVSFTIRIFFHYEGASQEEVLAEIRVENTFEVQQLERFLVRQNIIILPEGLISSIVGISISHGRALFMKNMAGTVFQEIIVPIVNPTLVAKRFFPYMFKEEATVVATDITGNIRGQETFHKKDEESISNK